MVAHLMGSVGNGDLEIAAVVLSVIETWGLVTAILESVVWRRQRLLVRDFLVAARRSVRGTLRPGEADAVIDRLLGEAAPDPMEVATDFQPESCLGVLYAVVILVPLLATVGLASIAARHVSALFTTIGFGPWIAAMWRARRRLADATAVQLTRNPAALAGAVRKLGDADVVIPEGWPVNFLFVVWSPITEANAEAAVGAGQIIGMRLETEPRLEDLEMMGAGPAGWAPLTWSQRVRRALGTPGELVRAVGLGLAGVAICALLLAVSLAAAAALLLLLWHLLDWIFPTVRPPS